MFVSEIVFYFLTQTACMVFVPKNIVWEYGEHQELHRKQAHNQDKSDYSSVTLQIFS